jgi:hypothetical protein
MVVSIHETAKGDWDVVVYADEDDKPTIKLCEDHADAIKLVVGPRIILTDCWNKCLPKAAGDILCQGNDDIVFRTPGWDLMVEGAFAQSFDKLLMVYGDDQGMHHGKFGPHPFVHRRWLDITGGWFIPPYFWSEFGDTWVNEVYRGVDRARFLPFVVEHMHYEFKKAEFDQTYRDRVANHQRTNPGHHYEFTKPEREQQTEKLRSLLGTPWRPRESSSL